MTAAREQRTARIVRWTVPVDGSAHDFPLTGPVLHVDAWTPDAVELWTLDSSDPPASRSFIIVGTGHPFPEDFEHVGSVVVAGGALVWHLMEIPT